jgi:hypothetical protein
MYIVVAIMDFVVYFAGVAVLLKFLEWIEPKIGL